MILEGNFVIVAIGEGAEARTVDGKDLAQEVHGFFCTCKMRWDKCGAPDLVQSVGRLKDKDEWGLDEGGVPFSITWEHESGSVTVYRLSN